MLEKLDQLSDRLKELEKLMSDPDIINAQQRYQTFAKEHATLSTTIRRYEQLKKIYRELDDALKLAKDPNQDKEFITFLENEINHLQKEKETIEIQVKADLLPSDENEGRNIIMEIRAGAGGDESSIFSANLFRMYCKYAETQNWKVDTLSSNTTGVKGFKEIIFSIEGQEAYRLLRFESGVHRVQRVPATEASGRIHTSTVTVAVLPEADDVEIHIDPNDLKIDVFRSSGPGGQSVNTTDSAVRIHHIPTGLIVTCQDEKSQHKNKAKAMRVLKARLKKKHEEEELAKLSKERKTQVGTGERNEKVRTYNYSQNRVTDHRIGLTLYDLPNIMEGNIDDLINALLNDFIEKALHSPPA